VCSSDLEDFAASGCRLVHLPYLFRVDTGRFFYQYMQAVFKRPDRERRMVVMRSTDHDGVGGFCPEESLRVGEPLHLVSQRFFSPFQPSRPQVAYCRQHGVRHFPRGQVHRMGASHVPYTDYPNANFIHCFASLFLIASKPDVSTSAKAPPARIRALACFDTDMHVPGYPEASSVISLISFFSA